MPFRTDLAPGWTLHLADNEPGDIVPGPVRAALPIPATVPGTVHTDLLAAGLIPDPYLDDNEATLDWIGRVPWSYERTLEVSGDVILAFDGLDTVATIALDGVTVAVTENMHRRYEIPVTLPERPSRLTVRFDPAEAFAEAERDRLGPLPNQYPAPFNYLRKMACNFGWDWGPALVTAGIWRPVTLRRAHTPRIREVRPQADAAGVAIFDIDLESIVDADLTVEAGVGPATAQATVSGRTMRLVVRVDEPALWWPVGLGDQNLYEATVRLRDRAGTIVDEWSERIGFRSVRLDTTPDAEGTPFVITVNDVPVPVRGANWIPDDCFLPRVTADRLRTRIGQAVEANINLLRVWGGGVYESGDFYRICDELGVLVWQDFLFACAAYPEDERLAREVEAEARDNVARLMAHPSLVLWNGNNENIWGFVDWDWQPLIGDRPWGLGYYLELLPRVVRETDPTRPYWPGSPYSGSMDIHPNHDDHGTRHIWDVWNEADYLVYRDYRPRFVAEFGWQAPPTWSTLSSAIHDNPLTPTSPGMVQHQKAADGHGKLTRGLAPHLAIPTDIDNWVWATQLNQARAVALGLEHFRALRPLCTGAIVWQLNDCWPVTSWSAVDGNGRRKPLWYALRAAYAPRLLTLQPRDGLTVVGVNDTRQQWREPLTVRRLSFDGELLATHTGDLVVDALGVTAVELPPAVAVPADAKSELLVASTPSRRALWFFAEDRDLAYRPADLHLELRRDGGTVELTMSATSLVRDVCVFADRIAPDAEADTALVTLLPGEQHTVRVRGVPAGREHELLLAPVLRSANDLAG